ncbi:protein ROOT INITIATION DEFECTIVE 3-like [Lotus japonicus]|uniref:protein ROOT INITIATION DEFECTIVE 3-like n=1 Tax=Lotus japonicus TaxID=34305 RepID=UPI002584EF8A|nr:protein ROOT INITIATION DEFECTIVE 3-like [Lotus japonicus]
MSTSSSREVIVTSSPDGPIIAYNASTGAAIAHFPGSRSPCRGLAMASPELIAVSHVSPNTGTGSIHLYNWYTSSVFIKLDVPEPVAPLYATSDGAFLFAGGVSGAIHSLSLPSGDLVKSFVAHSKSVSSLTLSDDESLLVSGGDDGTIVVIPKFKLLTKGDKIEDQRNSILYRLQAHSDSVTWLKFVIGCNSTLVSSSLDHTVKFWSLALKIQTCDVEFPCSILGVVMDSTESVFYAGGHDGLVYKGLMKVETKNTLIKSYDLVPLSKTKRHSGLIVSLILVNHGRILVSAADDGSVWAWNVERGDFITALGNNMGKISHMILTIGTPEYRFRKKNNVVGSERSSFTSSRLCEEEMIKTMKQITEDGDFMDMIKKDKKKAIEMMESTITTYKKFLRLIRTEARALEAIEEEAEIKKEDMKENK